MTVFIGNNPEQVPLNGTLGNMAFQSKERVNITGGTLSNVTINSPTVPGLVGTVLANGTLSDTVESVGTSTYNIASQYDVGTAPNQIPLNQYLGTMAYQDASAVVSPFIAGGNTPTSSLTLQSTTASGTSDSILFKVGNNGATTAMTINTSGNVGIGTASPGAGLEVVTSSGIKQAIFRDSSAVNTNSSSRIFGGAYTGNPSTIANMVGLVGSNTLNLGGGTGLGEPATNILFLTGTVGALGSGTERMRIDSSGNVGIGTASPANQVSIYGGSLNPTISTTGASSISLSSLPSAFGVTGRLFFGNQPSSGNQFAVIAGNYDTFSTGAGGSLLFGTSPGTGTSGITERMRIDSSGNVGIGTSSPSAKLDVRTAAGTAATQYLYTGSSAAASTLQFAQVGAVSWEVGMLASTGNFQIGLNGVEGGYNIVRSGATVSYHSWLTGGTERMRIDSSGNVGIGTSSPDQLLTINSANTSTNSLVSYKQGGTTYGYTGLGADNNMYVNANGVSATNLHLASGSGKYTAFFTATTERMRIDSSGNVGIGTSSPITKFDVSGGSATTIANVRAASGYAAYLSVAGNGASVISTSVDLIQGTSSDGYLWNRANSFLSFGTNNTERMRIDANGNVGIGTSSPGAKLNVVNNANAGTVVKIDNPNTGASAYTGLNLTSDVAAATLFTASSGAAVPNAAFLRLDTGTGGLFLDTTTAAPIVFRTNVLTERMRIDSSGNVGIGVVPAGTGLLELKAGTNIVAPLEFNSGTNLATPVAGAVEYDGTVFTATSNTNFKRGTVPLTNYASGTGTTLTTNGEATLQNFLPAANDTITLSAGTYFVDITYIVTRGASATTATTRLNILGSGNAVGNFSGSAVSSVAAAGATNNFFFDAVNINTSNVVSATNAASGGVYYVTFRGLLKITTGGTIVPQYNLSANINGAGTVSKVYSFTLTQLDSQSAAAFGPAGTGWG